MKRNPLASAVAALVFGVIVTPAAFSQTYDAASGLGSAPWSAAYRTGPGCTQTGGLLTTAYSQVPGMAGFAGASGDIPVVIRNTTSNPISFITITVPPNSLMMHPGPKGECAVLRFKAPQDGKYTFNGSMTSIDQSAPNSVRGYLFGPSGLLQPATALNSNNVPGTTASLPTAVVTLMAGEEVDFALDEGTNINPNGAFSYDSTGVSMKVGYERLPEGNGEGGVPVLNCSQSENNPPSVNLSTGKPGWKVVLPNNTTTTVVPYSPTTAWTVVPGAPWVGPTGAPIAVGNYSYRTQVRINQCPKGKPAVVTVKYRADNIGTLLIDGVVVQNQAGPYNYGFMPASLTTKVHTFPVGTSGIHTIEIRVQNTSSFTGMAANVMVTR